MIIEVSALRVPMGPSRDPGELGAGHQVCAGAVLNEMNDRRFDGLFTLTASWLPFNTPKISNFQGGRACRSAELGRTERRWEYGLARPPEKLAFYPALDRSIVPELTPARIRPLSILGRVRVVGTPSCTLPTQW